MYPFKEVEEGKGIELSALLRYRHGFQDRFATTALPSIIWSPRQDSNPRLPPLPKSTFEAWPVTRANLVDLLGIEPRLGANLARTVYKAVDADQLHYRSKLVVSMRVELI